MTNDDFERQLGMLIAQQRAVSTSLDALRTQLHHQSEKHGEELTLLRDANHKLSLCITRIKAERDSERRFVAMIASVVSVVVSLLIGIVSVMVR